MEEKYEVMKMNSLAKDINNLTFTDYYYRLMLLARSVFKWENLPNGIDEKWIEKYLFFYGRCMFFKDPEKGLMVAKCSQHGIINYYDEPTYLTPIATNYTFNTARYENNEECVLIRNNDDMIATRHTILLYAMRLAEIQRTIDVNINAQKTPVLITTNERQRLTLKNVYNQYKGNEPVIYGDKDFDSDSVRVLKTDSPIVFDKLQIQKHEIWNEVLTFMGINNTNFQKRERLTTSEVAANDEEISYSAQIMLKARQQAANQINEMFGTDIKVTCREELMDTSDPTGGRIYPIINNAFKDGGNNAGK